MAARLSVALAVLAIMTAPAMAEETVLLHAAGSLRAALTEVAKDFEAAGLGKVQAKFGASGLLKDEIAAGAKAEVFASANMEHPQALAAEKRSGPVVLFARNRLCALARPGLEVTPASLLDRMLDSSVKLGTSTPKADPSGDYAWEVFRKAEKLKPGASATLEKKALQLTGGPTSPPAPQGRSVYGELVAQGAADIFLTYCTNALAAQRENPGAADRRIARRARGRRRLRPDRDERRIGAGVQIRALHPVGGRPAHARKARLCRAGPAAIGDFDASFASRRHRVARFARTGKRRRRWLRKIRMVARARARRVCRGRTRRRLQPARRWQCCRRARWCIRLQPGAQASFEMPPERKPRTEPWHGGVVRLPALAKPGIYQITLSDDAWIDVIQNGRYARSVGSTGRSDCPGVRKSVRLDLDASPVVLQVSGVAPDTIAVTIGAVE